LFRRGSLSRCTPRGRSAARPLLVMLGTPLFVPYLSFRHLPSAYRRFPASPHRKPTSGGFCPLAGYPPVASVCGAIGRLAGYLGGPLRPACPRELMGKWKACRVPPTSSLVPPRIRHSTG